MATLLKKNHPKFFCVEVENHEKVLESFKVNESDVVILDWSVSGISGVDLIARLREVSNQVRFMVLVDYPTKSLIYKLLDLGVHAWVERNERFSVLQQALQCVLSDILFYSGKVLYFRSNSPSSFWIDDKVVSAAGLSADLMLVSPQKLTTRERDVVSLVAMGFMNKEIAAKLGISIRTVEVHRASAMRKIGVRDVPSLTRWCLHNRLIE